MANERVTDLKNYRPMATVAEGRASSVIRWPVVPQAKGGTYLGGVTVPKTLAPAEITEPVASMVPIAVFA